MAELAPFSSVDLTATRWVRDPGARHQFTLLSGETALAQLAFAGAVGSLAHAATSKGRWTLKRGGFLHPHITVRTDSGEDLARFEVHLHGGTWSAPGTPTYTFRRSGLMVPAWQYFGPDGRPVIHFEPVIERGRIAGGLVQVDPAVSMGDEVPLLIIAGWYYIVLAAFEDEALQASTSALSRLS